MIICRRDRGKGQRLIGNLGRLQFLAGEQWLPGELTMFERYAAYLAIVILIWITAKQFLPALKKRDA